jgi:hypothetical protein
MSPVRTLAERGGEVARANPTPNPSPFTGRGIQKAEWVFLCKALKKYLNCSEPERRRLRLAAT